jgi:hypothetical protein
VVRLAQVVYPQAGGSTRRGESSGNPQEGREAYSEYEWADYGRAMYGSFWTSKWKLHRRDIISARDCLARLSNADWWDWSHGSRPVHWKWPTWYQEIIRDGLPIWFISAPKQWRRPQPAGKNSTEHELVKSKLDKFRNSRYVVPGQVDSLTSFFAVPKGEDDIRMVFDGTKSGLNDSIWVPRFPLPTVATLLRAMEPGYYMSDFDVGEMFLNFVLHESMQALCGIDLTKYFGNGEVLWEHWASKGRDGTQEQPVPGCASGPCGKRLCLGRPSELEQRFLVGQGATESPGLGGLRSESTLHLENLYVTPHRIPVHERTEFCTM